MASNNNHRPATVRMAMWSARHRWLVFTLWMVITLGLFMGNIATGGTRTANNGDSSGSTVESAKAAQVWDSGGTSDPTEDLELIILHPTLKVTDPTFKTVVGNAVDKLSSVSFTQGGQSAPVFRKILDPYAMPPGAGLLAPDQTTARIVATVPGKDKALKERLDPVKPVIAELKAQNPGFEIVALDRTWANREITDFIMSEVDGSLKITLPLTFLFLLVAFGAVMASLVPLVLGVTSLLGAFGLMGFYSQIIGPVSLSTSPVIALIGLAVAVDYSLFMITRYRAERRHGRDKFEAILVASSTAGRAVFFSGLTVMISLAGLFLINESAFHSLAVGTIAVVLISVIGSLTFLPATLSILGKGLNWGRVPYLGREREEGSGFWSKLVHSVMRHPVIAGGLVLVVVLVIASPLLQIKLGSLDSWRGLPQKIEAVRALNLENEKWPKGLNLTMQVVVTGADRPETIAAIQRFTEASLKVQGLNEPTGVTISPDGKVARVRLTMAGNRNDENNLALIKKTRTELVPQYLKTVPGVEAYVMGDAASTLDYNDLFGGAIPLVFTFVLGLSFVLLTLTFRSIVIPIKAILLNLLSVGASYGLMVLVFQDGWLGGLLGIEAPGVVENDLPVFIFTILFGLSMDYHLFILTRIKEARDRGMSTRKAVDHGISSTSGTITSAASIMVMVFVVFVTLHYMPVRQMGFGLAVAVLVDAALIRSILLPASMELLGEWNWYMPKFLRWLPQLTIEAETEEVKPATEAVAA